MQCHYAMHVVKLKPREVTWVTATPSLSHNQTHFNYEDNLTFKNIHWDLCAQN